MKKSIKLSDYFKLVKPTYRYIKITPHKGIRNYNSSNIAKAIALTYKSINRRVRKEKKKYFIETNFKISYVIDIEKNNASFYFIVPDILLTNILEKISEIWAKATVEIIEEGIRPFSINAEMYQLSYRKEDALSLKVDKKTNSPLNEMLNVMEVMKDDDRVSIIYNFIPTSQLGWSDRYNGTIDKIKNNKIVDKKSMNFDYIVRSTLSILLGLLETVTQVVNDFTGGNINSDKDNLYKSVWGILEQQKDLSNNTKRKRDQTVLDTQISILSESVDNIRASTNAINVCQSFRELDEDNELVYKKIALKEKFDIEKFDYGTERNTLSCDEASNFIQLPGRELLNNFKISHIETLETQIPDELQSGIISVGENTHKGNVKKAYLSNDEDLKNLTLCIIGPTRAGKTTLLSNISKDAIANNETVINFDFCGSCDLSNDISAVIDDKKVLNIDCSDFDRLEGLGYNEIYPKSDNPFEVYRCAKTKTQQLVSLVNSINDDSKLEPRMFRYLNAAALVVFISNGAFKDVFTILQDHRERYSYIGKIDVSQYDNLEEYILTLKELDEWSRATKDCPSEVIGTKISFVQGILNRVDKLKANTYMELMFKKDCSNNINLVDEMQKSKLICIRMPEIMFSTESEKDIYCTYWLTKIWGALQIRYDDIPKEDRIKVNILVDELYQVPNCQEFLRSKLSQIAKKNCKPIISCHYLQQIKGIRNELKSANSSYMLISGCDKDNFTELKEELEPYEVDDLINLKRFHSLNLIKYENGWARFITRLPRPIQC